MSTEPIASPPDLDLEGGIVYEPDPGGGSDDEMVSISLDRRGPHTSSAVETATTAQSSAMATATTTASTTNDGDVLATTEVSTAIPLDDQSAEEEEHQQRDEPLASSSRDDDEEAATVLPPLQPQPITAATAYSFRGEDLPAGGENVPRNDDEVDESLDDDDSILEIPIPRQQRRRQRESSQRGQGEQQVEELRRCPCGSRICWAHACHSFSRCVKWICLPLILFLAASGFLLFLLFFCIPLICFLVILICFYYSCTEDPIPPRILLRALWSNEAGGGAMDAALGGGLGGANSSTTPTYTAEQLKQHLIRRACLEISEGKNLEEGDADEHDTPIKTSVTEVTATSLESVKIPDEDTKQEMDVDGKGVDGDVEASAAPSASSDKESPPTASSLPPYNMDERIRILEQEQGAVSLTAEKGNHLHEGLVYLVTEETERLLIFSSPLPYEEEVRVESETTNGFTELANTDNADAVASNESTELVTVETALATTGARVPPPASSVSSSSSDDGPQDVDNPDGVVSDDDDDSNWNWSVAEDGAARTDDAAISSDDIDSASSGRVSDVEEGLGEPGDETSVPAVEEQRRQEAQQSEQQTPPKLHHCASSSFHVHDSFFGERGTMCDICLLDYNVGDVVAWSRNPKCTHAYHIECIVDWLLRRPSCPSCRQDYVVPEEVLQHEKPATTTPVFVVQSGTTQFPQTLQQWTAAPQQQPLPAEGASNTTAAAVNNSSSGPASLAVLTGSADAAGPANRSSQDDSFEAEA